MLDRTAIKRPTVIVHFQNCSITTFLAFWVLEAVIVVGVVVE